MSYLKIQTHYETWEKERIPGDQDAQLKIKQKKSDSNELTDPKYKDVHGTF